MMVAAHGMSYQHLLSATQWEDVAEAHLTRYPDFERTVTSLKRKFKELYTKRVSTGDPHCPPAVRKAKRLKHAIVELMDGTDLQSEEGGNAADDHSMPRLGEGDGMPGLGEGEDNNYGGDDNGGDDNGDGVLNDNGEHPDDEVAAANAAVLNAPPAAVARPQSRAGSIGSASRGQGASRRLFLLVSSSSNSRSTTSRKSQSAVMCVVSQPVYVVASS